MKKEYIELFDRISPQSSNEEFLLQILGKAEKMEKKNKISIKKPIIAVFAAVLALTTATVTVGAATGWDFNSGFDAVFKNRSEQYRNTPVYQSGFDFAKYGKELDLHYTFDDYTLNIHGVIADKSSAYVVYDVVFNEDYDYGEKEKYTPWDMIMIMETADRAMISNDNKLIKADGNRFTFYHMASSTEENPIAGNTLVLEFIRLERGIEQGIKYDELYSEVQTLNCELTVEIPVDFDIIEPVSPNISDFDKKTYLIDYVNNEPVKVEAKLEKIELSPLSCEFVFMTDIADDGLIKGEAYTLDEFFFTYKNGEIVSCTPYTYSCLIAVEENGEMRFNVNLNQPIEPGRISSVTVGGATIIIE